MKITKKALLLALFIVFLFLRLFIDMPFRLSADNMKFLELARNFPYHTLYNGQLYLQHPPLYPYFIHFINYMIEQDYLAAVFISLLSAAITFFILYKFFMMLTNDYRLALTALLFFTLSVEFINASYRPMRESFMIMLLMASIYFYAKGVKFNDKKSLAIASLSGALTALTTDHVIFLFPAFALAYLFFCKNINIKKMKFPNFKYAIVPVIIILAAYGFWLGMRFYTYTNNEYYPAGLEGTPLKVGNFGFLGLFNPTYFEDYEEKAGIKTSVTSLVKNYAYNIGYMFNIEPFSIPRGLNFTTMKFLLVPKHILFIFIVYIPLAVLAIYGFFLIVRNLLKTKKIHNNFGLYIILLFLIFIFPITQKVTSPRYSLPSYIFLYFILAYGIVKLFEKNKLFQNNYILPVILVILLLLIPFWHSAHNNFVFFNKKIPVIPNTSDFVVKNIGQNSRIMAQPGYSVALIYLTNSKVIGLPPKPENTALMIKNYDIDYVVFGRFYTWDNYHYSIESVKFVMQNPDKFQHVAAIKEDYSSFFHEQDKAKNDEVYIYKVNKGKV